MGGNLGGQGEGEEHYSQGIAQNWIITYTNTTGKEFPRTKFLNTTH